MCLSLFLIKLQAEAFYKKRDSGTDVFAVNFDNFFMGTSFYRKPTVAASLTCIFKKNP